MPFAITWSHVSLRWSRWKKLWSIPADSQPRPLSLQNCRQAGRWRKSLVRPPPALPTLFLKPSASLFWSLDFCSSIRKDGLRKTYPRRNLLRTKPEPKPQPKPMKERFCESPTHRMRAAPDHGCLPLRSCLVHARQGRTGGHPGPPRLGTQRAVGQAAGAVALGGYAPGGAYPNPALGL